MALAHSPKIITESLSYLFDANDVKSSGIGTDTWKNRASSSNLTKSNLSVGNGVFSFNGDSSYADLGSNYTLDKDSSSIGGWFKIINFTTLSGSHTQQARIFVTSSSRNHLALIGFWNGGYGFENNVNSSPYEINSTNTAPIAAPDIAPGKWFNFFLCFDNGTAYSYVNGELITSVSSPNDLSVRYLGRSSSNTNYPDGFYGDIANFSIYEKALSNTEVAQNYNATKSRFGL